MSGYNGTFEYDTSISGVFKITYKVNVHVFKKGTPLRTILTLYINSIKSLWKLNLQTEF